uniref:RanBP2-type domain-containing protein n=1 Tax=Mucochytrium quahogii TaxID=96639 RepID=A0A7S2WNQ8_9STRA|mmetsp:Transcript_4525/g.9887  ORF Transcript_4525/g.9887 Transcript_4525/m.9887 type:complete len:318 (+) Transcript_4525:374-1327(+)
MVRFAQSFRPARRWSKDSDAKMQHQDRLDSIKSEKERLIKEKNMNANAKKNSKMRKPPETPMNSPRQGCESGAVEFGDLASVIDGKTIQPGTTVKVGSKPQVQDVQEKPTEATTPTNKRENIRCNKVSACVQPTELPNVGKTKTKSSKTGIQKRARRQRLADQTIRRARAAVEWAENRKAAVLIAQRTRELRSMGLDPNKPRRKGGKRAAMKAMTPARIHKPSRPQSARKPVSRQSRRPIRKVRQEQEVEIVVVSPRPAASDMLVLSLPRVEDEDGIQENASEPTIESGEDWFCAGCNFSNSNSEPVCILCGFDRNV